jgi:hypothetical protein
MTADLSYTIRSPTVELRLAIELLHQWTMYAVTVELTISALSAKVKLWPLNVHHSAEAIHRIQSVLETLVSGSFAKIHQVAVIGLKEMIGTVLSQASSCHVGATMLPTRSWNQSPLTWDTSQASLNPYKVDISRLIGSSLE